jgi:hypothetical protein
MDMTLSPAGVFRTAWHWRKLFRQARRDNLDPPATSDGIIERFPTKRTVPRATAAMKEKRLAIFDTRFARSCTDLAGAQESLCP